MSNQRTVLTAVTDDTGIFRIGRLKDGQYVISYERDGYLRTRSGPEETQLRVSGSDPTRFAGSNDSSLFPNGMGSPYRLR